MVTRVCVMRVQSLTLHGPDEAFDGVRSDTESSTLLHENGRDVTIHVQVVHGFWLKTQRIHELPWKHRGSQVR